MDSKEKALAVVGLAQEVKAVAPVVLHMSAACNYCDYFVILGATSGVHLRAVADAIADGLRSRGVRPAHVEGSGESNWMIIDLYSVIVHVFDQQTREFYDLERLWQNAPRVPLPVDSRRQG